jgi:hypothetical protein
MEDWWSELDTTILECLREAGSMEPATMAERLRIPETAVISLLCMLAKARRVRIRLVECIDAEDAESSTRLETLQADHVLAAV